MSWSVHTMVKALNATFEKTLMEWKEDLEGVNRLAFRNAEIIGQLECYRYQATPAPDVKQAVEWNLTPLSDGYVGTTKTCRGGRASPTRSTPLPSTSRGYA